MRQMQDLTAEPRPEPARARPTRPARSAGSPPSSMAATARPRTSSVDGHTLGLHVDAGGFLTTLFMLDVAGKKQRVIPRQVQLDPVTDRPVHVDFMRLAARRQGAARDPGPLQGPGILARPEARRRAQHRPPRDRDCSARRRPHPRLARRRPVRPRHPRHAAHQRHQAAGRRQDRRSASANFTVASIVAPTSVIEEQKRCRSRGAAAAPRRSRRGRLPKVPRRAAGAAPPPPRRRRRSSRLSGACGASSMRDTPLLIAGLGNPGAEYARNRHNAGFMAVDTIHESYRVRPVARALPGPV